MNRKLDFNTNEGSGDKSIILPTTSIKKTCPGVMLYFDVLPAIIKLSREDRGDLFLAILKYAQFGEEMELSASAEISFEFIRPRIDRDAKEYEQKVQRNTYAVYCRENRNEGTKKLTFDEWKHKQSGDIT